MSVGQLCVKIAGRDAGKTCVIVQYLDPPYVLIDGLTRRRKCNLSHLHFMPNHVDVKENASSADVLKALSHAGIAVVEKKKTTRQHTKTARPLFQRIRKQTQTSPAK
ncbi:50S ribosomal protein L14e [Candidatus Woesearchaeota archaeon]|nr:50S ribosomal protein L14e [Candidatus Woesearchaeota archaeon]